MQTIRTPNELCLKRPTVFLDFFGTLTTAQFWDHLPHATFNLLNHAVFGSNAPRLKGWIEGELQSEDIAHLVSEQTGIAETYLWDELLLSCSRPRILKGIIRTVRQLSKFNDVYIFTDNMDCFSRFTIPSMPELSSALTGVISSSEIRCAKSDFLASAVARPDFDRKMILVIDDSISIIERCAALGVAAERTTSPTQTRLILENLLRQVNTERSEAA